MKKWTIGAIGTLGLATLVSSAACQRLNGETNQPAAFATGTSTVAGGSDAPVVVTCQPGQRAMVRPVVINGERMSQVECVGAATPAMGTSEATVVDPYVTPTVNRQLVTSAYAPQPRVVSRPVVTERVVYQPEPVERVVTQRRAPERETPVRETIDERRPARRTKTRSAIIIGSGAGVGAGVGAAVGGKKGALIGAAIGGGGATIWDQVTRRK